MKDQYTFEDSDDLIRLQKAWDQVLRRMATQVPPAMMQRFIKPLRPVSLDAEKAIFSVPGRFVMDWVHERHLITLQNLLSDELGQFVQVELCPTKNERPALAPVAGKSVAITPTPVQETPSFTPNSKFTFDTYVRGQSNRMAVAGAMSVADQPGTKYNPLFIYGQSGLGKTHLMHAIAGELLKRNNRISLAYVTAQQFAEDFVTALQNNRIDQFRRAQRGVAVWLVDDIQLIAGKDRTQEEIFHTFNYLHSLGKQIVICSDRPPRDLHFMDERLRSRFESGLVADIQMPDTETRCAILKSKAEQEKLELLHEVAMYLAENVPGNIRVLEGALTKLALEASFDGNPINLALAQELVEKHYSGRRLAKPGFDQIVNAVSAHFKIPAEEICGHSRRAPIVHARHIAIWITREITGDSWKHIGSQFGDRDHTSMMHGYQKITEMMMKDNDLNATVRGLVRELNPDA